MTAGLPLIAGDDLDAPLAWVQGEPISRRRYLADVALLAPQLPAVGHMLNLSADRYRFAIGLGAAMLRGQDNLLPPNHTPDLLARLQQQFPNLYVVSDDVERHGTHRLTWPTPGRRLDRAADAVAALAPDSVAVRVMTSGSTGEPQPHRKTWGLLWRNARAGATRLASLAGQSSLNGVNLVATVPAQHMYGFESSLLVAQLAGAAFDVARPFYPADIATALARLPRPRMLVTTPLHLKTLLDSGVSLPAIDLTVCATAPLAPQLAARAEAALRAPLVEIYGCTEAGQVATRRITHGATWQTFDGLTIASDAEQSIVSGGHVPEPTPLADLLELQDNTHFRLLGRSNDLINIAGKRGSLSHLNFHLNAIEGVHDGVFWLPSEGVGHPGEVMRMVALVVAPRLSRAQLLDALRQRIDAAFLPRRIVWVDSLPRDATGKLPNARLADWAAQQLRSAGPAQPE